MTPSQKAEKASAEPFLACWFCDQRMGVKSVVKEGIIRGRTVKAGGPYRLVLCPACSRENICETTRKGRWFASPNYRFSILDYFFSQVLEQGTDAETFLAAASWLRENEGRRRYFFERDGDRRYSHAGLLARLWPLTAAEPPGARAADEARGTEARRKASHARPRPGPKDGGGPRERDERPEKPRRPAFITPHEILGVSPGASEGDIRAAFHRLAIHYHPDKVHHLGEEFERMAEEKFLRLKEAYDALMALRPRARP
ncbi:MAG TPA: J domain-containing protein [Planctomycetota bacterium]|nr:J domain-containing protein [Planctomycetota bacterium]